MKIKKLNEDIQHCWFGYYIDKDGNQKYFYMTKDSTSRDPDEASDMMEDSIPEPFTKFVFQGSVANTQAEKQGMKLVESKSNNNEPNNSVTLKAELFYDNVDNCTPEELNTFKKLGWVAGRAIVIPEGTKLTYHSSSNPSGAGYDYYYINDTEDLIGFSNQDPELDDVFGELDKEIIEESKESEINENVDVNDIAHYIIDNYEFDDMQDKHDCINSLRASFKFDKTISKEDIENFVGAHNGRDKIDETLNESSEGFQKEFYCDYVILRSRVGDGWDIYSYDGTPEKVTKAYLEDEGFVTLQAAKDEIDKWNDEANLDESIEDFASITSIADECGENTHKVSSRDIRFRFVNEDDETQFINKLYELDIPYTQAAYGVIISKSSALDESTQPLYIIKDKNGNQLSAPNPDDGELWDRVASMEARGRTGLSVVAYVDKTNKSEGPYIKLSDPQAYIDELDFAGAVEIKGDKVYADEETLRQLASAIAAEYGWSVNMVEELDKTSNDHIIDKETQNKWGNQPILHDEDQWGGKYKTFADMWAGEGYKLEEASYGGAFDIADDQYFTREDIENAAEEVMGHITETFTEPYHLGGTWFENGQWIVNVQGENFDEYEVSLPVDMRKIKEPWHLKRAYAGEMAAKLITQIKEYNGLNEGTTVSSAFEFDDDVDDLTYYYDDETFEEPGPDPRKDFDCEGQEFTWVKRHGDVIHIEFDNWAVWEAYCHDDAKSYYFVVDEDTEFIDWGPVETLEEAQEFLQSKLNDEEDDEPLIMDEMDEAWEPEFSDEWRPEDIELWKSIDWKARNYEPYIDETKKIRGEVKAVGLPGGTRTGEAMFAKEFSANPIFAPKWKPITDPFEGQGTNGWYMYDGVNADDGYMMMTRTETQEVSDALSH